MADGSISIELDIDTVVDKYLNDEDLGIFTASTAARYMDKYVPFDTGNMADSWYPEPFEVHYFAEYARYQYYGEHFHHPEDGPHAPLAQAFWNVPCEANDKDKIAKEITDYIRSNL